MKKSKKMTQPSYNPFFMAEKDKTANKIQTFHTAQSLGYFGFKRPILQGTEPFSNKLLKAHQNKKGQKNLRYLTKKQPFSREKDCFFVG